MTNPIRRFGAALKAFAMTWGIYASTWRWANGLGRTTRDYAGSVGNGSGNSIVQSCILWLCRAFPEAPLRVQKRTPDGFTPVVDHPLTLLLDKPNDYYSQELLWWATLADWMVSGNAYWLKVRSGVGRPVNLFWAPSTLLEPKWPDDGSEFISHYEYTPNGVPIRLRREDVVHFRYGFDPNNLRKGMSPLSSLLREIFTDDEASNFSSSLLANLGVPGTIITAGKDVTISPADAQQIKDDFQQRFGGDNRGTPLVLGAEANVTVMGFSPQQMDMSAMRQIPESRVAAVFGLPAGVVGLLVGLEHNTFSNYAEAREAAYESNIIPTQRLLAGELKVQLLGDFGDVAALKVDFDLSQVRVLQADQNDLHMRAREDLKAGLLTRAQALTLIGEKAGPDDDVLYLPISVTPTDPAELLAPLEPAVTVTEVPQNVRALPSGGKAATVKARKDASSVEAALQRLRTRLEAGLGKEMARFLSQQLERVVARLSASTDAGDLITVDEEALLESLLSPWSQRTLTGTHALIEDALGTTFDLPAPMTQAYLREVAANIPTITSTTREAIRTALAEGNAAGEGLDLLAARLRSLPAFNRDRAMLVARTELGNASNNAALGSYEASGVVVGVQVFDGDSDGECAAANGRRLTLAEARTFPRLGHPRCVRAFGPITDSRELEAVA